MKDVRDWKPGDRLIDFRGEGAWLVRVTRQVSDNKSALIVVRTSDDDGSRREYYADGFTNVNRKNG